MEAGEPPRKASIHAEPARWRKIKSVPAQVDIWSGFPGCSGHTGALPNGEKILFVSRRCYFLSVSGPFVILVIRVQVNMMMMTMTVVVLMMAPERAVTVVSSAGGGKRCFPASARTHRASSRSQKYIILCLYPFIGCCVLGGEVQVRCPTNERRGLQFTTTKRLFSFYPLLPKTSLLKPPQPNTRSYSGIIIIMPSWKTYDNDVSGHHQIRWRKMPLNAPVNIPLFKYFHFNNT